MKRNTLRSIGVGFLLAGILTGIFAVLQGNIPVEGVTVQSIFNSDEESIIEVLESEKSQLQDELSQLESTRNNLNANIASIQEDNEAKDEEIRQLQDDIASLEAANRESQDESDESEETSNQEESINNDEDGIFTIQEGETSQDIANRLEEAGYINSAQEFQDLLDDWNLHDVVQVGEHELTQDMNIHEIATIITGGNYYYSN